MTATALSRETTTRGLLESGLIQMGLTVGLNAIESLLRYVTLLDKWNKTYNLTAVREPNRMIGLHVLDSLSIFTRVQGCNRILDVGTGGGLPGIPLAIALATSAPATRITMLDAVAKKTAFVQHAIGELGLINAEVVTHRVQQFLPLQSYDMVISRAFADLTDFVESVGHLCAADGKMIAMKGVYPLDEIARVPSGFVIEEVVPLQVPQVEGQRHIVVIRKNKTEK